MHSGINSFESRVISDGSQTCCHDEAVILEFESRVISDGSQTLIDGQSGVETFESRVISDGSQTICYGFRYSPSVYSPSLKNSGGYR